MEDKKNPDPWAIGPASDETTGESGAGGFDATQWHEVQKGETLWKIAEQYYGDGNLYPKIFDANRDILKDPNRINIGQKLRIP
jgi:nucleoid-associated protein YgaU